MLDWPGPERVLPGPRVSLECHLALDCQLSGTFPDPRTSFDASQLTRVICGYQSWSEGVASPFS